jgi:hypothetical protein
VVQGVSPSTPTKNEMDLHHRSSDHPQDNVAPLQWPLGRIHAVHPGPDGVIRVVSVKSARGVFKRPINEVCVVPMPECTK